MIANVHVHGTVHVFSVYERSGIITISLISTQLIYVYTYVVYSVRLINGLRDRGHTVKFDRELVQPEPVP